MKHKGKIVPLLISTLLLSLILTYIPLTTDQIETTIRGGEQTRTDHVMAGISHTPIDIDGDAELNDTADSEMWSGDGSENSPFIIEGLDIDRYNVAGHCISIVNTRYHFVIRNCYLCNASVGTYAGIWLDNVTGFLIEDNRIENNYYGVYVEDAENGTIFENEISAASGQSGISLSSLRKISVSENLIDGPNYGIWGIDADFCEISGNTIDNSMIYIISLNACDNCTLAMNTCIGDGGPIGIYLLNGYNNTLSNIFFNNTDVGLQIATSANNTIDHCMFEGHLYCVYLANADDNYLWGCVMEECQTSAIRINDFSERNRIYWNTFRNNTLHAFCSSLSTDIEYNYYDNYTGVDKNADGFGDTPYLFIGGPAGEIDYNPIMYDSTNIAWSTAVMDQHLEFGEELKYNLDVFSKAPVRDWSISDTTSFIVDNEGMITNRFTLDVGTYSVDVKATNVYDFSIESSFSVIVSDTVNPIWISQVIDRSYNLGEAIEFQILAWDLAGIEGWMISDTANFTLTAFSYADTGIATITGDEALAAGAYSITLSVFDTHGNIVATDFTVTVMAAQPVGAFNLEFIMSTAGLGISIVALVIGVGAFLNTRKKS